VITEAFSLQGKGIIVMILKTVLDIHRELRKFGLKKSVQVEMSSWPSAESPVDLPELAS
jgi:hypothetical protein